MPKEEKWKCLNPKCGKLFVPYVVEEQYGRKVYSTICKKCKKELEK